MTIKEIKRGRWHLRLLFCGMLCCDLFFVFFASIAAGATYGSALGWCLVGACAVFIGTAIESVFVQFDNERICAALIKMKEKGGDE